MTDTTDTTDVSSRTDGEGDGFGGGFEDAPISVLFVDDDALLLRTLRRGFALATWDPHFVESGAQALEILEQRHIDVVVTDQRMPHMSGVELLAQVRERWPHIVRVMLTGNSDQATAVSAVNDGKIFAFVNKPWEAEHLRTVLLSATDEARRMRAEHAERRAGLTGRSSVRLQPDRSVTTASTTDPTPESGGA